MEKMKNKIDLSLIMAIVGVLILVVVSTFAVVISNRTIHSKNEQIKDLNQEIGEYQAMESFWEDYIDLIGDIYEGKIREAVLEERVKWLSLDTVVHKFDKNYDFYLLVIVSRTKVNDDIWLYGVQEIGNTDETGYVESDELFSVDEKVIAVEISENQVILIDIRN